MGLLTFFLVFYGNHCYERYYALHGHCIAIGAIMWKWAQLIRANFGHKSAAMRWNMMRPMLGAMHIHYAFLRRETDEIGHDVLGVSPENWRAMRRSNLFTRAEIETLQAYHGNMPFLAASWALGEAHAAIVKDRGEAAGRRAGQEHIRGVREPMARP